MRENDKRSSIGRRVGADRRTGVDTRSDEEKRRTGERRGKVARGARKLLIQLPDGSKQLLEQIPADQELQLQEQLKNQPEPLPLDDLGLLGPR